MSGADGSRRWGTKGNRRVRRVGVIALALLFITVGLAFLFSRYRGSLPETAVAVLISGGTLSALYLAWVTYRDSQAKGEAPALGAVADELAVAVGSQWEQEAAVRRLNDPYPMSVRWLPADSSLAEDWDRLVALAASGAGWPASAGAWASGPDELAGSANQLADVLALVPTGRLVVLGEPGSGKTMLMVRLVLDLLRRRSRGDVVPVLLSVASWNPVTQAFRSWLVDQLLIAHPALAAPFSAGEGSGIGRVEALLQAQLVMPILDGFDELPHAVRGQAIAGINDQLRPGERLVMTSRVTEYREATRPAEGPEIALAAAAVELRPLELPDVITYLRQAAGGPRGASRWDPVFAALTGGGPLGEVFSNPLMVGLARGIYNPRPGERAGALPDPAELCLLDSTQAVEGHLLDAFIPAAYRTGPGRDSAPHRWNAQQAEKWLTFLAYHLEEVVGKPGLAWWELKAASPVLADVVPGALAGVMAGIPVILVTVIQVIMAYALPGSTSNDREILPHILLARYYWQLMIYISLHCGIAGGVAGWLAAVGPRRTGDRQAEGIRLNGRMSYRLPYAIAYSLATFKIVHATLGWPDHPTFTAGLRTK